MTKAIKVPTHDPGGHPIHRIFFSYPVGYEGPKPCGKVHELEEHVKRDGKHQYDSDGNAVTKEHKDNPGRLIKCPACVEHHLAHRFDEAEVELEDVPGGPRDGEGRGILRTLAHVLGRGEEPPVAVAGQRVKRGSDGKPVMRVTRENVPHHIGEVVEV
jgi:hypothetical protein